MPEERLIDIVFAISAAATDANANFRFMKDTLKSFARMYGTSRIHYGIIAYGALTIKWIDFQNQISDVEALRRIVDSIPRERGELVLNQALEESRKLFHDSGVRPQSRKVLAVLDLSTFSAE